MHNTFLKKIEHVASTGALAIDLKQWNLPCDPSFIGENNQNPSLLKPHFHEKWDRGFALGLAYVTQHANQRFWIGPRWVKDFKRGVKWDLPLCCAQDTYTPWWFSFSSQLNHTHEPSLHALYLHFFCLQPPTCDLALVHGCLPSLVTVEKMLYGTPPAHPLEYIPTWQLPFEERHKSVRNAPLPCCPLFLGFLAQLIHLCITCLFWNPRLFYKAQRAR